MAEVKPLRYAIRADYDKRHYEVYEIATGLIAGYQDHGVPRAARFRYRPKESERAKAAAKAHAIRDELNEKERNRK